MWGVSLTVLRQHECTIIYRAPSSADDEEETYHFVEEPSRDYFCPILDELLLEPHLTECCGQHLSERAVEQLKRRIRPCPMCAMPLVTIKDIHFRRKVRELPVFCPNKNKGCQWVAEVSAVKEHMEVCPWKFSSLRPGNCLCLFVRKRSLTIYLKRYLTRVRLIELAAWIPRHE